MIYLSSFLQGVQWNANRIHAYELGHDGSDGKSDCIGLIIGALGLAGFRWPGVHGSNWAARNAMDGMQYVSSIDDIFLGEIVYKAKEHGEEGYELPDRYKVAGGDLRDYYHVGVVTGIDPPEITHCTSVAGGIKRDTSLGKWRWGGMLKYVDYEGEDSALEEALYIAVVTAPTGKTVRMRTGPSEKNQIIEEIPIGELVEVLDVMDGWSKIRHNGVTGYMMTKFLMHADGAGDGKVDVSRAALKAARSALMMAMEAIDKVLEE